MKKEFNDEENDAFFCEQGLLILIQTTQIFPEDIQKCVKKRLRK